MPDTSNTWDGGYITDAGVYVIRRQVNGTRYEVSTRCRTSRAAHEQLKRFETDPENYDPTGASARPIYLDADLARRFLLWSRDTKGNSPEWVRDQKRLLAWWAERLDGRDLRRATLKRDLLPALKGARGLRARIEVIKVLYSWLVGVEHAIRPDEDPTFRTLRVPQARPEQWQRVKAVPREDYEAVRAELAPNWRDCLDVLAGTGWHVTELGRFARAGQVAEIPRGGAFVECPQTKGGEMLRVEVSAEVAAAARRVRERGGFSRQWFDRAVKKASGGRWKPGQMRHSVATIAIDGGADPAAVAAFLGHKSPRTTRKFYATHAVPAKVPTLR